MIQIRRAPDASSGSASFSLKLMADSRDECNEWYNALVRETRLANDKANQTRVREYGHGISQGLSDMVIYCRAMKKIDAECELSNANC